MALSVNDYSEMTSSSKEPQNDLIFNRYQALKEAGFDDGTALSYAKKSEAEVINDLLATSLNSNSISNGSTHGSSLLSPTSSQFDSIDLIDLNSYPPAGASKFFLNNKYQNGISDESKIKNNYFDYFNVKDNSNSIQNKDNLNGIHMGIHENGKMSNGINNSCASKNHNSCDTINSLLNSNTNPNLNLNSNSNSSLKPVQLFGIDLLEIHKNSNKNKTTVNSNYLIDLNKDKLGSQIVSNQIDCDFGLSLTPNGNGFTSRKTFADIASANTMSKKIVQPPKGTLGSGSGQSPGSGSGPGPGPGSGPVPVQCKPAKERSSPQQKMSILSLEPFPMKINDYSTPNMKNTVSNTINSNTICNGLESFNTSSNEISLTKPTNLMGYKGLWACNISPDVSYGYLKKVFRKYGNFTGLQVFERKATNGSNIVFVHYDNCESPREAISELYNIYRKDICVDPETPLRLRFTPSSDQTKGK